MYDGSPSTISRGNVSISVIRMRRSRPSSLVGIPISLAKGLKDAAEEGEVVVSSTVRDLVAGSGLRFSERATLQLEGVQGEWRLYALDA